MRWGRDGLWEHRSVVFVLGKGQQCATGTFQMLRESEELPVKGYYKTITKSRSCLGKGWSKQAGRLAVSSLPGVPAARLRSWDWSRVEIPWDTHHRSGMCQQREGSCPAQVCQTVASWMLLSIYFFSFFKQTSSAIASARWRIQNFWWSGINILFSWHVILFKGIFITWDSSLSRPQPVPTLTWTAAFP